MDACTKAFKLGLLAMHEVHYGDMLVAMVTTSSTPPRVAARHKVQIEQAVLEAGKSRFIEPLTPKYGSRVNRQLGRYYLAMAQEAFHVPQQSAYVPALILS